MCLHMFTYYPRMNNLRFCWMTNSMEAWARVTNDSMSVEFSFICLNDMFLFCRPLDYNSIFKWLTDRQWTTQSIADWQTFYNSTSKVLIYDNGGNRDFADLPKLPDYEDFEPYQCKKNTTDVDTAWRPSKLCSLLKMMEMTS